MEFSFVQTQTFLHFLLTNGVLSDKQQAALFDDFSQSSSRKFLFILADFFKKLTPSDAYDMAFRLFSVWEKQKGGGGMNPNPKPMPMPMLPMPMPVAVEQNPSNSTKPHEPQAKKQENYKITIRNYKFSNMIRGFVERVQRKNLETCFKQLKKELAPPAKPKVAKQPIGDYFLRMADFKREMDSYANPTFRFLEEKKAGSEDVEGPRPFLITPYKAREESKGNNQGQDNGEVSNRTLKSNSLKKSGPANPGGGIHEKLFREASLKKMNQTYLENIKKKQEVEGCTFRPNIQKPEGAAQAIAREGGVLIGSICRRTNSLKTKDSEPLNGRRLASKEVRNEEELTARCEKLYQDSELKRMALIEKQRTFEEMQMRECTFQPKTSKFEVKGSGNKKRTVESSENKENGRKMRSISNYEKGSSRPPMEMRDLNEGSFGQAPNHNGSASTKFTESKGFAQSCFEDKGFVTEKSGLRKAQVSRIAEKPPSDLKPNKRPQSFYFESDFQSKYR